MTMNENEPQDTPELEAPADLLPSELDMGKEDFIS
jgi:hypothetical protein